MVSAVVDGGCIKYPTIDHRSPRVRVRTPLDDDSSTCIYIFFNFIRGWVSKGYNNNYCLIRLVVMIYLGQ